MIDWSDFWNYEPGPLDLDAGITRRGSAVSMYKHKPGLYLDDSGNPVSDEAASEAGFDIEDDRREARKNQAIIESRQRAIDEHEQIEARAIAEVDAAAAQEEAVERNLPLPDADRVDIIARNSKQEPTETRNFKRDFMSGIGKWSIIRKDTKERIEKDLTKEQSFTRLMELQSETDKLMARV